MKLTSLFLLLSVSACSLAQTSWRKAIVVEGYDMTCPSAVDYDRDGNVLVLGTVKNAATPEDVFVAKFNGSGKRLWLKTFDQAGQADVANALAVDSVGNVFVGATSKVDETKQFDIVARKYSPTGALMWSFSWDGGDKADHLKSVASCPDGGAVIAGYTDNGTNYDAVTIRIDVAGTLAWSNVFDSAGNDWAVQARSDGSGRITTLVTGEHGANSDVAVLRFDPAGVRTWQTWLGPENQTADRGIALTADSTGNTYVASQTFSIEKKWDFQITKLTSKGAIVWNTKYDRAGFDDYLCDMSIDGQDGLYVTGTTSMVLDNFDVTTLKINRTSGGIAWQRHWGVPIDRPEQTAVGIVTNAQGQTAMTYQLRTSRRADIRTEVTRLNPNGSLVALSPEQVDLLRPPYSEPIAIALRPNGIVYMVGFSAPSLLNMSGFLVRLSPP